jgi:hypothetical protein
MPEQTLRLTLSVNMSLGTKARPYLIFGAASEAPMHKSPKEIARALRLFRRAHGLRLLRCVRIAPSGVACDAARSQAGIEYSGDGVPRLPLAHCTRACCECDYEPVGSERLDQLNVNAKSSAKGVTKGNRPKRS